MLDGASRFLRRNLERFQVLCLDVPMGLAIRAKSKFHLKCAQHSRYMWKGLDKTFSTPSRLNKTPSGLEFIITLLFGNYPVTNMLVINFLIPKREGQANPRSI